MPVQKRSTKGVTDVSSEESSSEDRLNIKKILSPVDLSAASMQALNYAIPIAERFQADLHLLYVHENSHEFSTESISQLLYDIAKMRTRVESTAQSDRPSLIRAENCHVLVGRAYKKVCDFARDSAVDLIVLATRGQTGLARMVLGSTAERIVQFAPCPVLVARQRKQTEEAQRKEFEFALRNILVPTDFSQCSMAGLKYAALFARTFDAKLLLFHALFPPNPVVVDRISVNRQGEADATRRMNAQMEMEALTRLHFLRGVACKTEIRSGYAIQEICAVIERANIDLVITSTHGQTGFETRTDWQRCRTRRPLCGLSGAGRPIARNPFQMSQIAQSGPVKSQDGNSRASVVTCHSLSIQWSA
jgi:nucleotide-binding universal stress UspA family protein